MYISQIIIKNFRMFKDLNLTLNKGLNVFVGENNSGKTSILDAIKYVLDTNSADRINIDRENDFYIDANGEQVNEFKIHLIFSDLNQDNQSTFLPYLTYEKMENNIIPQLHITLICNKNDEGRNGYIRRHIKTGKNEDGKDLDPILKDELEVTYLKPLRDAENELIANRGSRLSKILEGYIHLAEEDFIKDAKGIFKEMGNFYENITRRIDSLKEEKQGITETIQEKYLNALILQGQKKISLGIKSKDNKNKLREILTRLNLEYKDSYGKEGLGYQNILFMAAEFLLLESERYNQAPIMLIEEPEAHLHPQLQMNFLNFIRSQKDKFQIFITTHSPNLSSKVPISNLYICCKQQIYSLREKETGLDKQDYIFLEKFLDVTKADLFFARGLLLVEGISEQLLFARIAELLDVNLEKLGISIIALGNTSFERFLKIFQRKNGEDIPIPIGYVTDLDLSEVWDDSSCISNEYKLAREKKYKFNSTFHKGFVSKYRTLEIDLINKNREKICHIIQQIITPQRDIYKLSVKDLYECYIERNKSSIAYNLVCFDINGFDKLLAQLNIKDNKSLIELKLQELKNASWTQENLMKAKELLLLSLDDIPQYLKDAINYVAKGISQ